MQWCNGAEDSGQNVKGHTWCSPLHILTTVFSVLHGLVRHFTFKFMDFTVCDHIHSSRSKEP